MLSFFFHPSYSGSAVQAKNLGLHLKAHGVESIFVSANLTNSPRTDVIDGMEVHRLPACRSPRFHVLSFWLSLAWFLWRNRNRYDVIHAHGTFQHAIASLVGRLVGKPTILKIAMANSDIAFHKHGRLWGRINRFLVRRFDRYIATSEEVRTECIRAGLDQSRVRLIPNGVDTDRFYPARTPGERSDTRRALGLRDVPTVCYVGVIDARKNVDTVVRAWKAAQDHVNVGQLVLIGPRPRDDQSEFYERLLRYVAENGLSDSVVFAGPQDDVPRWLRAADIFMFPSRREGMPNALLEAISTGLPSIASRIGGSIDIVRHGVDGFLFDVDDEQGMASALRDLLESPELAARMGTEARRRAVDVFSLRTVAQQYSRLYTELLESS